MNSRSAPNPVPDYWNSLPHDHPGETIPFLWAGPAARAEDTFRPRLFIGLGHQPPSEDDPHPPLELVLLFTGTNASHPGEFIQSWMELSTDLDNVIRRGSHWLTRIQTVHAGGFLLPDITARQRQLALDMLVAFRAFASNSRWNRLPAADWPRFYQELTEGLTEGEFVRAEPRLARLQAWLYEKYGQRLYTNIPLAERERVISGSVPEVDVQVGEPGSASGRS